MTKLLACIGIGKGTWSQVIPLIENEDWEKIIIVTSEFGKEKFPSKKELTHVVIDPDLPLGELEKDLRTKIRPLIGLGDVGVNFISGTGKEHMAVMAALLRLGVGVRLVAWDGEKLKSF